MLRFATRGNGAACCVRNEVDFELQSFRMHIRTLGLIPSFEERRETVHLEKAANNGRGKSKFATAGPRIAKTQGHKERSRP